jgi:hypothetical protein
MRRIPRAATLAAAGALCAATSFATDRWESPGDSGPWSFNTLHHDIPQAGHDFESTGGAPDEDWYDVTIQTGHSYEAIVFGGSYPWAYPACPDCGSFDRVDGQGNVLTAGTNEGLGEASDLAVRWIGDYDGSAMLRARPGPGYPAGVYSKYDVVLRETTCFLPRFNNTGTQATVLLIQNTLNRPTQGQIHFFDAAGGALDVVALSLAPRGLAVLNTSLNPALAGKAGSARIGHLGGFGAIMGKAVSVDPAIGLSFETPLSTLP